MNITVVGVGYVGLVTAVCLAENGNKVDCIDIDKEKVKKLNQGKLTIYEPGLKNLFLKNLKNKRLTIKTILSDSVESSEIIFLALPTPQKEDGSADLDHVLSVSDHIGKIINDYKIIVSKSTVPVGTSEKIIKKIKSNYSGDFDVVSNPEFLKEGVAVEDFMKPERIVIGSESDYAKKKMEELYSPFIRQGNPIIFMDNKSAELTKYAANSYLATKISYMNELANISEVLGADIDKVRLGIGTDSRIGKKFLFPGIGYGGSCLPKDVKALVKSSSDVNYDFKILKSVIFVNENQSKIITKKILKHFGSNIKNRSLSVWGLSFKPNTDDIREAPSLKIIDELLNFECKIKVYDPEAIKNVKNKYKSKLIYYDNQYECIKDSDGLIIMTEWNEFRAPDFKKIKTNLKTPTIFDGRNLYDNIIMKKSGFNYYCIGK